MIQREFYLKQLRLYRGQPLIKALSGIRRCGKSTLLKMVSDEIAASGTVAPEQRVTLNFEDMAHRDKLTADALYDHLRGTLDFSRPFCVFLDEIQQVAGFERVLDSLFVQPAADIYVTGSNARFLSSDLATLLTGRFVEIRVFPLSFAEYVSSFDAAPQDLGRAYQEYVAYGSLPEAVNLFRRLGPEAVPLYLRGVLDSILYKDIVPRYGIKDVARLQDVTGYVFDAVANTSNPKRIADYLASQNRATSHHTVENYLSALANVFLVHPVGRFDVRGKMLLQTLKKYYVAEPAFRALLTDAPPSDYGRMLENVVALELMRRYGKVWIGKNRDREIDFVVRATHGDYAYFQVALTVRDPATLERELAAFPVSDHYPKTLLTLDPEEGTHNGIRQRNALKWLLDDNA
jgi:predicted AAA+ superfamily ATPase